LNPNDPQGRGLNGTAGRTGQPQWTQDYLNDPRVAPWHEYARQAGWLSSATLPLSQNGKVVGCLVIYTDTVNAFDEDTRKLLVEMAMDISFALDNFSREEDRRHTALALRASETRYRLAFQTSQDGVCISRVRDGVYVDANRGLLRMLGFNRNEVIGHSTHELNIWESAEARQRWFEGLLLHTSGCRTKEFRFRKKNGDLIWGLMSASVMDLDGEPCVLSFTQDISDIKAAEEEIKALAFHDSLTQLPNRLFLTERLHQVGADVGQNTQKYALLFVDLDDFKTLNDSRGHTIGDLLLQEVAHRLVACVRHSDTVARLGGDEFVVLIEELGNDIDYATIQTTGIGEKILAEIARPCVLAGERYRCTVSIGIAMFAAQHKNPDELLTQADIAMYQAKADGRNTLCFFSNDLQEEIDRRLEMKNDLHLSIEREYFQLYYQPQVDHGGLVGAEALIRWNHPARGLVSPGVFIPLAEETGLILPLGRWVLETACRQIATWGAGKATAHLALAVNVSALQLRQPDFVNLVLATLGRTGANPRNLKLELTESMLVDDAEGAIAKMAALRSQGVRFALDDFGTGYSSLSYLKRLPLDQLKIDRSFVRDVPTDADDVAITQTIVALGQAMGLPVIAEGVETEAQRDFLSGLGCQAFQGFLFGRPVPLEEFEATWNLRQRA
jgi:diguanylate cyclase (GGDEF)-like protein/PAS domain S-box-containing protein